MVKISDVFIGTEQSRYAAFAIFSSIMAVCLFILFTSTDVPIGQRFGIVLFIIIFSIPSVLMTLFELTCIVTGGTSKKNQWCHYFAWIVSVIIIIYSIIIIISVIMSLFTYNNAMDRVVETENAKRLTKDEANKYAENMMKNETTVTSTEKMTTGMAVSDKYNNRMANDYKNEQMSDNKMMKQSNDTKMKGFENNGLAMYGGYEQSPSMNTSMYNHEQNNMMTGSYPSGTFNNPMSQWEPNNNSMNNDSVLNGPHIGASDPSSVPSPYSVNDFSSF